MTRTLARIGFLFPALILLAFLFSSHAHAGNLSADIRTLRIDPNLRWPGDLTNGQILILDHKEIVLKLGHGSPCPANAFCRPMDDQDLEIRMPVTERFEDSCGSVTLTATRIENGLSEKLSVTDNSHLTCFIRKPATEIKFERSMSRPFQESGAFFKAEQMN